MAINPDAKPFRTECLDNGLILEFFDKSNRYFGDYHRLRIEILCRFPVDIAAFADTDDPKDELRRALTTIGDEIRFTRNLEKMGVEGDRMVEEKEGQIAAFFRHSVPYLESPSFPGRLIARELLRVRERRRPYPVTE